MRFKIKKRINPNLSKHTKKDIETVRKFSVTLQTELKEFLKAVVLFGGHRKTPKSDIDVLILLDDITSPITQELIQTYKIITENAIEKINKKIHATSMTLTSFVDYSKVGDPVIINVLRDGVAVYDTNIFEPMQELLRNGKIRPTMEAVHKYFDRAPRTILNSKWHVLQATLDLYWAVVDAGHAALMRLGEVPPTPSHMPKLIHEKLVKKKLC